MTKEEAKKRIEKLKKEINHYRYLYHVLDRSEISDAALDSLKHELFKLEKQYPEFITPDSPTQRVGGQALNKFKKVRHKTPMLSIEDIFSEEELLDWQKRIQKLLSPEFVERLDYFAELKIDGFAISLIYKDGIFVEGSTRGDGIIGEDVTQNLRTIESIPLRLKEPYEHTSLEIRGEVYMDKNAFEKVNSARKKQNLPLYANPRNTAAGSIRQLDPKLSASRDLKFLAYDLVTDLGQTTHEEKHQITKKMGFKTDEGKYCKNLEEIVEFWKKIMEKREELPFQIDGVVVSVNNNRIFEKLGVVGKARRGMVAYKFPAKQATTVVEDIKVQIGRTGALTPVAYLKPVQLGGTTISRATLHNEDEIKKLGVKKGDTVVIQRAGDVIPDIVQILPRLRTGKEQEFHMPKQCPVCGSKVIRPKGEAIHRCSNRRCGAIQKEHLYHFVSKKAFDIAGLGPKIIDQLMDKGLVSSPSDIFELTEGDLLPLERFAEKSASNLIDAINKSKTISLNKFIFALGIRHAGEESAINLASYFGSLKRLKKVKIDDLLRVKDTGEVMAKSIFDWFNNKNNLKLLEKLDKVGVKIISAKRKAQSAKLKDKIFVLTGELESLTRDEAKEKIRQLGGDISSSVSKNTDFVVAGAGLGSKYEQAINMIKSRPRRGRGSSMQSIGTKKLGIKIINEKEFLNLVK